MDQHLGLLQRLLQGSRPGAGASDRLQPRQCDEVHQALGHPEQVQEQQVPQGGGGARADRREIAGAVRGLLIVVTVQSVPSMR